MGVFHVFKIVQMVQNRVTQHICAYIKQKDPAEMVFKPLLSV